MARRRRPVPGSSSVVEPEQRYWDLAPIATSPWEFFGDDSGPVYLFGLEEQLREFHLEVGRRRLRFRCFRRRRHRVHRQSADLSAKNWYQSTWRVPITVRYGLTEVFGGASQCGSRVLAFDPLVIPEVVDAFSCEPIETGSGVLVLTCFTPSSSNSPSFAIGPGTSSRWADRDCPVDDFSFRLLGRLAASVVRPDPTAPGAAPLIAGDVLFDILDGFPDIATSEVRVGIHGQIGAIVDHRRPDRYEQPWRARVTRSSTRSPLRSRYETRYSAFMYPDAERDLLGPDPR